MSGGNEVTINPGSSQKHQVGGVDNKEGVAMLVADSEKNFSSPLHPVVTVAAATTNPKRLGGDCNMAIAAAKEPLLGLTSANSRISITANRGFLLKALATNGGLIYLGAKHVLAEASGTSADAVGFVLEAGASVFIEITDQESTFTSGD